MWIANVCMKANIKGDAFYLAGVFTFDISSIFTVYTVDVFKLTTVRNESSQSVTKDTPESFWQHVFVFPSLWSPKIDYEYILV